MICLVLAAGYATRLYPLTEHFPKPLLEVQGKPILDWLVGDLDASRSIDRFVVISNHKYAAHFEAWAAQKALKAPISVIDDGTVDNEGRLGAVADVQLAIDRLGIDEDMMVIAGDNVLDFSLQRLIDYFKEKRASCAMRYFEPDLGRLKRAGVLKVDATDRIRLMVEKPADPPSHWCAPPFYIYARNDVPRVAQAIAEGINTDAPGSLIAWLSGRAPVYAMEMPGKRYDIGDLASYEQVQASYRGIVR